MKKEKLFDFNDPRCIRCGKSREKIHKKGKNLNIQGICEDCWVDDGECLDMWDTMGVPDPNFD